MTMKIKPNAVQQYRKSKGWSQQHLADLCSVNLRTIQRVENTHACSLETLNALLSVFEIDRENLIELEKEKVISGNFTKLPLFDWRKNMGLILIFIFLAIGSVFYIYFVQQALANNAEIRWFSDFYISLSNKDISKTTYYIIPFKLYVYIISLGALLFFCARNSMIAASISVFWLPVIYLDNALNSHTLTPITICVSLIIGYVMWKMRQRINSIENDI